jgi:N utilization substance protein A
MEVIVPDEFLSIAIGKKGQNVRLASKLTGWHLDVKSETRYSQAMQTGYDSLVALPGVGVSLADALYESGFYSAEEIASAGLEDLMQIRGIGEEKAAKLLEAARNSVVADAEAAAVKTDTDDQTSREEDTDTPPAAEDSTEGIDTPPAVENSEEDSSEPAAEGADGDEEDASELPPSSDDEPQPDKL